MVGVGVLVSIALMCSVTSKQLFTCYWQSYSTRTHTHARMQTFAKFVPREVVRYLVTTGKDAVLRMNLRETTVFFSDIASFTTICEALKATELYALLSTYFEEMSKIITDRLVSRFV